MGLLDQVARRALGSVACLTPVVPLLLVACMPAAPDRGLERELRVAREEAALEQRRVYELENRLIRLEESSKAEASASKAAAGDATLQRQLDVLIALNQQMLVASQANREQRPLPAPAAPPTPTPAPAILTPTQSSALPECNAGLTTEQKILQLVLSLKNERSPWRVDGLSYEESQALRVLLREERALDRDNPWQ